MFEINYPFGYFIKFQAIMTLHFQKPYLGYIEDIWENPLNYLYLFYIV